MNHKLICFLAALLMGSWVHSQNVLKAESLNLIQPDSRDPNKKDIAALSTESAKIKSLISECISYCEFTNTRTYEINKLIDCGSTVDRFYRDMNRETRCIGEVNFQVTLYKEQVNKFGEQSTVSNYCVWRDHDYKIDSDCKPRHILHQVKP